MSEQELERLSAYLDGDLEATEREQVSAWLAQSEAAREALASLRALKSMIAGPVKAPDQWGAIRAELPPSVQQTARWQRAVRGPLLPWALAGVLALVLVWIVRPRAPEVAPVAPIERIERIERTEQIEPVAQVDAAREVYLKAIEALSAQTRASASALPPEVWAQVQQNLQQIDASIQACERLLKEAPDQGQSLLLALYDEKVRVLRAALSAAKMSQEAT